MANLHSQFKKFEEQISISPTQRDLIVKRHSALRTAITNYFKLKSGILVPDFYIQGSYKMNTMVQKKDGSFEVSKQPALEADAKYEDTYGLFFDADKDGDEDLWKDDYFDLVTID